MNRPLDTPAITTGSSPDVRRKVIVGRLFGLLCLGAICFGLFTLGILLADAIADGWRGLKPSFFTNFPSRIPENSGIRSALFGTLYMIGLVIVIVFPVGVGSAIYLEEYSKKNWFSRLIEVNVQNLAAVPSIVYGLLGLGIFVRAMRLGQSILAGAMTMSLLVLPIVVIAGREAIRAVPQSIREAAYGLGASKWQVTTKAVLPAALPGILTGVILAISRAIGEAAPLITIGALSYVAFQPRSIMDDFTVLPIQIFNWVSRPQPGFHSMAASAIIVLVAVTIGFNSLAVWLRGRLRRRFGRH